MKQNYIFRRSNGIYYFLINVPSGLRAKFKPSQIWKSLGTRCEKEAKKLAAPLIAEHLSLFETAGLLPSDVDYVRAKELAASYSLEYSTWTSIVEAPLREAVNLLGSRLELLEKLVSVTPIEVAAIGGTVCPQSLTMPQLFSRFQELAPDKVSGKNYLEARKKWSRFQNATEDFSFRMPDITNVLKIERRHVYEYRAKLIKCVDNKEFKSDHAGKNLMWLEMIFKKVIQSDYPQLQNPFDGIDKIKIDDASKRAPFTQSEIEAVNALVRESSMSAEAKAVLKLGELTGCSVKELVFLESSDIRLDQTIPSISIGPNTLRRAVKKGGSRHREIPLTGEALEIMKAFPDGFLKFQSPNGPDRMNRAMSDFFKKAVPGKGHYSYRHRLDDLLKNSGCDLGLKSAIMGHFVAGHSTYYGNGYDLEQKLRALEGAYLFASKKNKKGTTNDNEK